MPATTPRRWTRRLPAIAAIATLPMLSACSMFSPATTAFPYNASEGASVDLGQLHGANLLVVGPEEGAPAVLSGALYNKGTDDLTVTLSTQDAPSPVTIQVPAQSLVRLTADSATPATGASETATVLVPSLPVAPGAVMTVVLATRAGGQTQFTVPVMLPRHEYATVTAPPTTSPS